MEKDWILLHLSVTFDQWSLAGRKEDIFYSETRKLNNLHPTAKAKKRKSANHRKSDIPGKVENVFKFFVIKVNIFTNFMHLGWKLTSELHQKAKSLGGRKTNNWFKMSTVLFFWGKPLSLKKKKWKRLFNFLL